MTITSRINKLFNSTSKLDKIAYILLAIFSLTYLYLAINYTFNAPKAQDDLKIFLIHLNNFLSRDDTGLIDYLFLLNKPHVKLDSRIITLVSYFIVGSINYKFILIIGHLLHLYSIFLLRIVFKEIPLILFTSCVSFLLIPSAYIWNWSVGVWGYLTYLFLVSLTAVLVKKGQTAYGAALSIFSTFTLGSGIVNFILGVPDVVKHRFHWKKVLYWAVPFIISFIGLYLIVKSKEIGVSSDESSEFDLFQFLNYSIYFLNNSLFIDYQFFTTKSITLLGYVLLFLFAAYFGMSYKKWNQTSFIGFAILAVLILNGLITALFRITDPDQVFVHSPNRYEIFSKYFLSILFLTAASIRYYKSKLNSSKPYIPILIAVLASLNYYHSTNIASEKIVDFNDRIKDKLLNSLAENNNPKTYNINFFIKKGLFKVSGSIDNNNYIRPISELKTTDNPPFLNTDIKGKSLENKLVFLTGIYNMDQNNVNYDQVLFAINSSDYIKCDIVNARKLSNWKYLSKSTRKRLLKKDNNLTCFECIDYPETVDYIYQYDNPTILLMEKGKIRGKSKVSVPKQ